MKEVRIFIEIAGKQVHAGTICGQDYSDAVFTYSPEYLALEKIKPISISLPLQEEAFSPKQTTNYFEGLLPEGFSRRAVANWVKTDEKDYLTILEELGRECLGAVCASAGGNFLPDTDAGSYELLTDDRVKALAAEGATTSTKLLLETHLSLTGASGKVGLYYDESDNKWYLPKGNAPSTYIVKQSHVRLNQIVLNEQICMKTAANLGIPVPDSFIINIGNFEDEDILYATKRYDRILSDNAINHLKVPYRLHQEDFAQAMGIGAARKYETVKNGYLKEMFLLLGRVSSNPIEDVLALWDMIVFNFLVGNTDAHLKNYSLLYDSSLRKIRLAPAYDIVSTTVYRTTDEMSMYLGSKKRFNDITRSDFETAAEEAGIGRKVAMKRLDALADRFEDALNKATLSMKEQGFQKAGDMQQMILEKSGYSGLK